MPNPTAQGFARAHLLTLWLFAGFHKLLSPAFMNDTAPRLLTGFPLDLPDWTISHAGYVIAIELGTGLLALSRRTRKAAAFMAFGLHTDPAQSVRSGSIAMMRFGPGTLPWRSLASSSLLPGRNPCWVASQGATLLPGLCWSAYSSPHWGSTWG